MSDGGAHPSQAVVIGDYNLKVRIYEITSIIVYVTLLCFAFWRIATSAESWPWLVVLAVVGGAFVTDLLTGLYHWFADTWGTVETPIIGNALVRPFREHHVDQKSITRHDWIETNGSNCFVSAPFIAAGLGFFSESSPAGYFTGCFLVSLGIWGVLTNQFHKWAHTDEPPGFVRALQNSKLILPPDHHRTHHTFPFDEYYGVTNGWTNWLARKFRFYKGLEWIISQTTGMKPREDDMAWVKTGRIS